MFGTYRTLLAMMVVGAHLGPLSGLGTFAVFGFYILSGYLMTLILHASYGYSRRGVGRYALNRFLRIYPTYWVACLISIAILLWVGTERAVGFHERMFLPGDADAALRNLLIFFRFESKPRLLPPAWALTVELFFYACIGIGLSRTRWLTLGWFAASVLYTVAVCVEQLPWKYRYALIPAASLPFSTGALIYHYRDRAREAFPWLMARWAPALLVALVLCNYAVTKRLGVARSVGFYLSYALNSALVLSLVWRTSLPGISRRLDERLGAFSYPIYLTHLQAGLLLVGLGVGWERHEIGFVVASLPVIFGMSWLLVTAVEGPIEKVRRRVKP